MKEEQHDEDEDAEFDEISADIHPIQLHTLFSPFSSPLSCLIIFHQEITSLHPGIRHIKISGRSSFFFFFLFPMLSCTRLVPDSFIPSLKRKPEKGNTSREQKSIERIRPKG